MNSIRNQQQKALAVAVGLGLLIVAATSAFATNRPCTTTTTIPDVACPAVCPTVVCPEAPACVCPVAEVLELCKVQRDGQVVCPRAKNAPGPRRILVPRSLVDSISDIERY